MRKKIIHKIVVMSLFAPFMVSAFNADSNGLNIEVINNKLHYKETRSGYEFYIVDNGHTINMRGNRNQGVGRADDEVFYPLKFTLSIPSKIKELYLGSSGEIIVTYPDYMTIIITVDRLFDDWFTFDDEIASCCTNTNTLVSLSHTDMQEIYKDYLGKEGFMHFNTPYDYRNNDITLETSEKDKDEVQVEDLWLYKMYDAEPKKSYHYVNQLKLPKIKKDRRSLYIRDKGFRCLLYNIKQNQLKYVETLIKQSINVNKGNPPNYPW